MTILRELFCPSALLVNVDQAIVVSEVWLRHGCTAGLLPSFSIISRPACAVEESCELPGLAAAASRHESHTSILNARIANPDAAADNPNATATIRDVSYD